MIELGDYVEKKMVYYARQSAPIEACALLLGEGERITEYYPMRNRDESEVHFSFDPKEQNLALKEARSRNQVDVGVYHSHPSGTSRAYPSTEDIERAVPGYVYFILNFQDEELSEYELGAYEIDDGEILERNFEVVGR